MTDTAAWIAAARARESARQDRLFDDPWAATLAGESGRARLAASERASGGENRFLPVRTRFFDDAVLDAAGWARQFVLLGAGLDTRAYRLALPPDSSVFELDHAGPLAAKEAVLSDVSPAGARAAVEVDLAGDWRPGLLAAGFDPSAPTMWLAEGLLCHLSPGSVRRLVAWTAALSRDRAMFGADLFGTGLLRQPGTEAWLAGREAAGEPPPYCTDEPAKLFGELGWPSCSITEPGQAKANYGRLREVPADWSGGSDPTSRTYLVLAENSVAPGGPGGEARRR